MRMFAVFSARRSLVVLVYVLLLVGAVALAAWIDGKPRAGNPVVTGKITDSRSVPKVRRSEAAAPSTAHQSMRRPL